MKPLMNTYLRMKRPRLTGWMAVALLALSLTFTSAWAQTPGLEVDAPPAEAVEAPATTQAPNPLASGELTFYGFAANEPYSFHDIKGEPMGYDVEVMKELARELGVQVKIVLLPRPQAMAAVLRGEGHGLIGLGHSRAHGEDVTLSWELLGPTVERKYRLGVLEAPNGLDADEESSVRDVVKGARIGMLPGDPIEDFFEGNRDITIVEDDTPIQVGRQLLSRRVLAYAADENSIRYVASKLHDDRFRLAGKVFYEVYNYGPAVPQGANAEFASRIRGAIQTIRQNGRLAEIHAKWFNYRVNQVSLKPFILIGVAGTGVFILVLLVMWLIRAWRTTLRETVEKRTRKLTAEVEVLRKQVSDLQARDPSYNSFSGEEPALELSEDDDGVKPLVLEQLFQEITDKLQATVGENTKLAIQHKEEVPPVLVEPEAITRVLVNLCSNARDAIATQRKIAPETPDRVWISLRIADDAEKPAKMKHNNERFVAVSVRDAGCGISQDMVQKIFQKGFSTKDKAAGEGLSQVYAIIARHGGWIDVESAAGRGATISVYLPAVNM